MIKRGHSKKRSFWLNRKLIGDCLRKVVKKFFKPGPTTPDFKHD